EILPPVAAVSKHAERLCQPGRQASRAHQRGKPGFSTSESGLGRETDSPHGFEPLVPQREGISLFAFSSPPLSTFCTFTSSRSTYLAERTWSLHSVCSIGVSGELRNH